MHYNPNSKTIVIFLCLVSLFLFQGCERKKELPVKPKVISKKIKFDSGGPSDAGGVGTASASVAEPGRNDVAKKTVSPENESASKPDVGRGDAVAEVREDESTSSENGAERTEESIRKIDFPESGDDDGSMLLAAIAESAPLYDPADKIDPFMPLFKDDPDEKEPVVAAEKKKTRKRIPRTPLERIALSQLKLVGIIRAESGDKGLVQEVSGKGYVIAKGTYIGTNGGRVTEILKEKIVVEEEVEDVLGKPTIQKRELKLQKPFGEN